MLRYYTQLDTSKLYGATISDVSGVSLQCRGFGAKAKTMRQRASQAYTTMGRPIHHCRGAEA
jgi:hypothetical protein